MASGSTRQAAITPQGIRDGDPAVLAALAARRGPAVLAFAEAVCAPAWVVRVAADAFARFRAAVVAGDVRVHPDALLLRCAHRAALDLAPPGPDLGCGPAKELLALRAERAISPGQIALLDRHLGGCEHCRDLAARLAAGDAAYRHAEDAPLAPAALAPIVAALAAAGPVDPPLPEAAPAANGAPVAAPEPELPEVEDEAPAEPEPEPEPPEPDPPPAPRAPYYEIPEEPPRPSRTERLRRATERATAAGEAAAALTKRAGEAARKRLDRAPHAEPPLPPETPPPPLGDEMHPTDAFRRPVEAEAEAEGEAPAALPDEDTTVWQPPADPDLRSDPDLEASAARAAARHYRRLRHRLQQTSAPPRLRRPHRDRPHLPLTAHGPRDLALSAGLLVVAALVIMAVAGVFGGGGPTPPTGTQATGTVAALPALQSPTAISLAQAQRLLAATGAAGATKTTP